jgi:hypothetical protein
MFPTTFSDTAFPIFGKLTKVNDGVSGR